MKSTLFWLSTLVIFAMGVARVPEAQATDEGLKKFEELDMNRDKRISEQEFVGDKGGASRAKARKQFRRLDENGDRWLTLHEFKRGHLD